MPIFGEGRTIEDLEEEKQRKQSQLEIEEKKALIAEAKRRYGGDWKRHFTKFISGTKSGIDWQAIKFRVK